MTDTEVTLDQRERAASEAAASFQARWVLVNHDDLVELLRVLENEAWHHSPRSDEAWKAYNSVVGMVTGDD